MSGQVIGARTIEIAFDCAPVTQVVVTERLADISPFVKVIDVPRPFRWGITVGLHPLGTRTGASVIGDVCKALGIKTGTHVAWNDSSERS